MKSKLLKVLFFTLILFLCVGIVSAEDNNTANDNIKDIIDNCDDGVVKLDEKTYHINPESETHITLNRSITIEGTGETVIDGKNTTLYLDVFEENKSSDDEIIIISPIDLFVKNKGSNIVFKNITFKDLNLISRHEMEFIDCKFIKTNYTSKELNNTFVNCIFNESEVKLSVYDFAYKYGAKIINCTLYNAQISSLTYLLTELVGSDRIFISNSMEIRNLKAFNSDILLNHYNINVTDSLFDNSSLRGSSDKIDVFNSSFSKFNPTIYYSDVNFENATFNNSNIKFIAGYYAKGCEVFLKDSILNKTTLAFNPNFYSGRSKLIIKNSTAGDCEIKSSETDIEIHNSKFNKSTIELFFSNIYLNNSLFYNNGPIKDTFKTKTYIEQITHDHGDIIIYNETYPVKTNYTAINSYFINASGLYKIDSENINVNTLFNLTYDKHALYCINDTIIFRLTDHDGNPISNKLLYVENPNDHNIGLITDKNGKAFYTIENKGELNLKIYYDFGFIYYGRIMLLEVNLTVHSIDIKMIKDFKNNRFSNIKSSLKIKLINYTNLDISKQKVIFKIYTGKNYKTYPKTTDSNGSVLFKIPAKLDAGVHKIQVIFNNKIMKTTSIKINKAKTIVKAPKITNKFKKSNYFKVTVKNKETKKMLSNVKVKVKIYTGKKYKTYTVKTNKKGIAKINTKNLKIGKHKVIISSGNKNYSISGKSLIKIKK
ncbi:collagen binding domain-containing protein [Methanobrevibacter sp.]|uniref:MSCRAMM family protein n=1 Tax=Methanobrevibacter sp. TaxID=66852 RepID=UPI00388E8EC1